MLVIKNYIKLNFEIKLPFTLTVVVVLVVVVVVVVAEIIGFEIITTDFGPTRGKKFN